MTRKRALVIAAVVMAVASGLHAWWATTAYNTTRLQQGSYYQTIGFSAMEAEALAASTAAAASNAQAITAWACLAACVVALIAAIVVKP